MLDASVTTSEEKPHCHQNPRRVALESARKEMQTIGTIIRPKTNHAFYMALGTNWGSVKY